MKKKGKYSNSDIRQVQLTDALLKFIAGNLLPLSIVDSDPLLFWQKNSKKFPSLSKIAQKYLHIPATSAPVERIFSVAGKTFTPDRCRLGDTAFEQLMNIKCNLAA